MSPPRVVVERTGEGALLALVDDDGLAAFLDGRDLQDRLGAALWLGRVAAIDRHLDGAFLDIGRDRPAFLAAKDARYLKPEARRQPIHKLLHEGERLIVQGLREADGDKGPRVTAGVVLDGPALRYRPRQDAPGVGGGMRGRLREGLAARAEALFAGEGFILRPVAARLDDDALLTEAARLRAVWREAEARTATGRTGAVTRDASAFDRRVWELLERAPASFEAVDEAVLAHLRRLLDALPEDARPELVRLRGQSAFTAGGVAEDLAQARAREVPLPGGGRLVIEPTAACVAVDVDGGGRAALDADLEAATVLGRQIRLRNLGGTIVVDFVDLPTKPQRQRLEEALRRAFNGDPLPVQIYPMSPLGIVQISRARRGGTALDAVGRPCPTCGGSGVIEGEEAR
ncbi:MAG: ribonuclease E/G [Geminicoccaceae bacterium]|nr:ribonuclease E/G [Geminicoccaceae bacterium]